MLPSYGVPLFAGLHGSINCHLHVRSISLIIITQGMFDVVGREDSNFFVSNNFFPVNNHWKFEFNRSQLFNHFL